jgi:hypothetical protein
MRDDRSYAHYHTHIAIFTSTITKVYDLELSRRLNSMKSSRGISGVRFLYETDVSRAISVLIRGLIQTPDEAESTTRRHGITKVLPRQNSKALIHNNRM